MLTNKRLFFALAIGFMFGLPKCYAVAVADRITNVSIAGVLSAAPGCRTGNTTLTAFQMVYNTQIGQPINRANTANTNYSIVATGVSIAFAGDTLTPETGFSVRPTNLPAGCRQTSGGIALPASITCGATECSATLTPIEIDR